MEEEAYPALKAALSLEYLRENLTPDEPGVRPRLNMDAPVSAPDDTRPGDSLTRGETAVLLYGLPEGKNKGDSFESSFTDISAQDDCYAAVAYLEHYGILSGYPDGTLRPNAAVTRWEGARIVNRMLGHETPDETEAPLLRYEGARVSFDYPADWALATQSHEDGSFLSFTLPEGSLYFSFGEAWLVDLERTSQGFGEAYGDYEDLTVLSREELTIDGHDGLKWTYTYRQEGEELQAVLYETVCPPISIQLFYNCSSAAQTTYFEEVAALAASLVVVEPM